MRALWDSGVDERKQSLDAALPRLAERALNEGARLVMIKAGASGIYLRAGAQPVRGRGAPESGVWAARELWAPALTPDIIVTANGAGDSAVAGFLAALLRNESPELALTMACAAGACCCEKADATSGVRSWDETLARLRAGWQRVDRTPALPGWRWDEAADLWRGPHDR
jgi:sugar/nucleoside kinase (ribokinase family)